LCHSQQTILKRDYWNKLIMRQPRLLDLPEINRRSDDAASLLHAVDVDVQSGQNTLASGHESCRRSGRKLACVIADLTRQRRQHPQLESARGHQQLGDSKVKPTTSQLDTRCINTTSSPALQSHHSTRTSTTSSLESQAPSSKKPKRSTRFPSLPYEQIPSDLEGVGTLKRE
jgi:hypothetical protein